MNERSKVSWCRICGADITFDAALGLWTDRLGHLFCGRPPGAPRPAVSRAKADAARFPPAAVATPDASPAGATGAARRLQALMAIGHCEGRLVWLARQYGARVSDGDIAGLVTPPGGARVTVSRGTRDAICRLYDDLWDQPPPEDSPGERAAAAAARARARRHDWPAPAALDDDLIDDPAYRPEGGWLPATLAGVPRRPVPAPAAAPPASLSRRRGPAARLARPVPGHRTSTPVRGRRDPSSPDRNTYGTATA